MAETRWAVYVRDDPYWGEVIPAFARAGFGAIPPGARFVSEDDGSQLGGHVEFGTRAEAERFVRELSRDAGPSERQYGITEMD